MTNPQFKVSSASQLRGDCDPAQLSRSTTSSTKLVKNDTAHKHVEVIWTVDAIEVDHLSRSLSKILQREESQTLRLISATPPSSLLRLLPDLFTSSCVIDLALPGQAIKWQSRDLIVGSAMLQLGACSFLNLYPKTVKEIKSTTKTGTNHHLRIEIGNDGRQRFILTFWGKLVTFETQPTRQRLGWASNIDITNIIRQLAIDEFATHHRCTIAADLGNPHTIVDPLAPPITWDDVDNDSNIEDQKWFERVHRTPISECETELREVVDFLEGMYTDVFIFGPEIGSSNTIALRYAPLRYPQAEASKWLSSNQLGLRFIAERLTADCFDGNETTDYDLNPEIKARCIPLLPGGCQKTERWWMVFIVNRLQIRL
jgi:hypothetical protein